MDLKDDLENHLKDYLDAPPSQAVLPLSSPNYGYDDDGGDIGAPPGIRGFEDSDSGEEDGDSRLSLWPRHHNDPRPKPHPLDESGVFCREWGRPATIMKRGTKGASWTAPLISQNLFGRSREAIITELDVNECDILEPPRISSLRSDPIMFNACFSSTGSVRVSRDIGRGVHLKKSDQAAKVTSLTEKNSPRSSEACIGDLSASTLAESLSDTLVGSPSEESSLPPLRISSNPDLLISGSPIPCSTLAVTSSLATPPPVECNHPPAPTIPIEPELARPYSPKANRIPPLIEEASNENRASGGGEIRTATSDLADKFVAPRRRGARGPRKHFLCPARCGLSFTRANDAERHFKNAAIHRDADNPDSSTCCRNCGEELSRLDARNRHEAKNACGKRRIVRKLPGHRSSIPA